MATIFMESGGDATQGFEFYTSTSGTLSVQNTVVNTGPQAIKCNPGAGGSQGYVRKDAVLNDTGRAISFYIRFSALDNADMIFVILSESGGSSVFKLILTSGGLIKVVRDDNTSLGTGTTALSTDTWYRVAFSYTITNTTTYTAKLYLNGTLELTPSGTLDQTGSSFMRIGHFGSNLAVIIYLDDLYVDDRTDATDPGNIHVTNKRPNANGTTNGFTTQIGAGGSGYGSGHSPQVNEQPLSTTNGWSMVGAGSAVTEEYTIENAATGDVDLTGVTLVDFESWVYASSLVSETASIITAGSSSNISLTNTNTLFTKAAGSTTYPSGGDAVGIITGTDLTTVSLYEAGVLIAYTPTTGPTVAQELPAWAEATASGAMIGRRWL